MRPVLLLTRPRAASERFAEALPQTVLDRVSVLTSPLIGIEFLVESLDLGGARGIVFTSANAVDAAAAATADRTLLCHCVGEATAAAARNAGWHARNCGANSDELVTALAADPPPAPLLHLSGRHTRGDIASRLSHLGIPTRSLAVYDQPLLPLSSEALAVLAAEDPVIAPIFSPRTARHFADLVFASAPLHVIGLSEAVVEPLKNRQLASLEVAETPDASAMIRAIASRLDGMSRVEGQSSAQ